MLVEIISFVN